MRLKLPSSRYFEDDADTTLSPRDVGVLMHRAFERADGVDDVRRTLDRMVADASISRAEYAHLRGSVERAFENPLVAEWFGAEWDEVRNEGDILTPRDHSLKRPDRVMLRGESVDYKFGRKISPAHASQLGGYMSLLRQMGYADVEGYIWYVSLDRIEKI